MSGEDVQNNGVTTTAEALEAAAPKAIDALLELVQDVEQAPDDRIRAAGLILDHADKKTR